MNKRNIIIAIISIILIVIALNVSPPLLRSTTWNFVGYQYKWSKNYVENKGFNSQLECAIFGDMWLKRQDSDEAMYTCTVGCKNSSLFQGAEVCNRVCEYNKEGFQLCRE